MANLGEQAGSGFDASDLTTGTLGNTVQDNITRLGTVTTGTLGANVAFNDAHKDIDRDNYILLNLINAIDTNSDDTIGNTDASSPTWGEAYKGSNITHPYHQSSTAQYGKFKVSKAGIYMLWVNLHVSASTNDVISVSLLINGSYLDSSNTDYVTTAQKAGYRGGRLYVEPVGSDGYTNAGAKIWIVPTNANDYFSLYGVGNFYGSTANPMSQFGAIRLGAG